VGQICREGKREHYPGFSHPVRVRPPEGINFDVDPKTGVITVWGADKETVGRIAAEIRAWRPAGPYLGKGLRYLGEQIRRKAALARGEATDASDVDVVVELERPDLLLLVGIKQELEELLQRPVDVVRCRERMNPFLKKRILRDAVYV
jgi:hypothetical protein